MKINSTAITEEDETKGIIRLSRYSRKFDVQELRLFGDAETA